MYINIYDKNGKLKDKFNLNDDILLLDNRRVSISVNNSEIYYKGTGIKYNYHFVDYINDNYIDTKDTSLTVYQKYRAIKKCFIDKTGIFLEKYQPYFSDYIGGCGLKERNIINNSKEFLLSGVDVLDVIDIPNIESTIYKLKYKDKNNIDIDIDNRKFFDLVNYFCNSDWCSPFDKKLYNDIDNLGLLRDVSDIFKSNKFEDKLGTIYAMFYSLKHKNIDYYRNKINYIDLNNIPNDNIYIPLISLIVLNKFNNHIVPNKYLSYKNYDINMFKELMKIIYNCKNVSQLENYNKYKNTTKLYEKSFKEQGVL